VLTPATGVIGTKPTRALKDDVIYEVHVRGLTMNDTSISAQYRGTYRGAGLKAAALAALGVTAVEFLPLQETDNDDNDVTPTTTDGDNYWGYMTLELLRARPPIRVRQVPRRPDARAPADGPGVPRRGDQGLRRRRLQPHW
jgi:hypothetical protein